MPTAAPATKTIPRVIKEHGPHLLFQRSVQFEMPSTGLVTYFPGDSLTLSENDISNFEVAQSVVALCAFTTEQGGKAARAKLFNDRKELSAAAKELREAHEARMEKNRVDADLARGWFTRPRGGAPSADVENLTAENAALKKQLDEQAERLAALEKKAA